MRPLRGSRALVTGAGGFVGANLVRALAAEGAEVHGLVAPSTDLGRLNGAELELHRCDVSGGELAATVRAVAPQFVFSLAVSRGVDAARLFETNVTAVANLLEIAHACGARVIHLGSATEYGPSEKPLHESAPEQPVMLYGVSKAAATLLCRAMTASLGMNVVVLRPFMVYGPQDRPERFVPTVLAAAAGDADLDLTAPGFRRDWVFVGDVAEACLRVATANGVAGEVLNVGTGQESEPAEIVALVSEITGRALRTRVGTMRPRAWDREHWVADLSKLERTLAWRPTTDLRDGLQLTYDWFVGQAQPAAGR
jgi:nucleoside-diphosphate-sugar epimerase